MPRHAPRRASGLLARTGLAEPRAEPPDGNHEWLGAEVVEPLPDQDELPSRVLLHVPEAVVRVLHLAHLPRLQVVDVVPCSVDALAGPGARNLCRVGPGPVVLREAELLRYLHEIDEALAADPVSVQPGRRESGNPVSDSLREAHSRLAGCERAHAMERIGCEPRVVKQFVAEEAHIPLRVAARRARTSPDPIIPGARTPTAYVRGAR